VSALRLTRLYACPHCAELSVSGWQRSSSSLFFPARCRLCGGESIASGWSSVIAGISGEVLLWASLIFALAVGSFYGLLILPVGMIVLGAFLNKTFPLVALDAEITRARRRAVRHFCIAVAIAIVIVTVPAIHMNMPSNNALERSVRRSARGAAGAREIMAPAAHGWVVPRPAQRGR
jgi:hypothetical protein